MNKTRGKVEKVCEECGKIYNVFPSKVERSRFCSNLCQGVYFGKKRTIATTETCICSTCGKVYDHLFYPSQSTESRFCSRKCRAIFYAKMKHAAALAIHTCPVCGEKWETTKSDRKKYCSLDCMGQKLSLERRGEGSPNWQGGKAPLKLFGYKAGRVTRKAKVRDGYTCQCCNKAFSENSRNLHVHHIVPFLLFNGDFESANDLNNLVTLCHRCHVAIEAATRQVVNDIPEGHKDVEKLHSILSDLIQEKKSDFAQY